jgi:hypothetical protein
MIRENLSRGDFVQETVEWGYEQNPVQNANGYVLEFVDDHGHISQAGVLSIAYRDFYIGTKQLRAALCGDFVVAHEHRSLQPAIKLLKDAVQAELASCPLIYGFPNDKALGVLKMAGFKVVGKMTRYACVLETGKYIQDKIHHRLASGIAGTLIDLCRKPYLYFRDVLNTQNINISESKEFDNDLDKISRNSSFNSLIHNCRNAGYLNWRYFSKPGNHYSGIQCMSSDNSRVLGYAIIEFEPSSRVVHIRDMFAQDKKSFRKVLSAVRLHAMRNNAVSLSISMLANPGLVEQLSRSGYSARESYRHVLVNAKNSDLSRALLNANGWYVMDGDEDQ